MNAPGAATRACLDVVAAREPVVRAWAWLDPEHALAQAEAAPSGPLSGLPVGIKDVIDTADMPTENGSPLCAGRRPAADAVLVRRLRRAGAVVMGKTMTTEFALAGGAATTNPHDPARSPGASSAGSAAAVAAGMVPLAVGTQTVGSVLRPAAYCGVVGFKPSHGLIPCEGIATLSERDQVGVFAHDVAGAAGLAAVLMDRPIFDLELPDPPRLAFIRTAVWPQAEPETRRRIAALAETLGAERVDLPAALDDAFELLSIVVYADIGERLAWLAAAHGSRMSVGLRQAIERGRAIDPTERAAALARLRPLTQALDEVLAGFDGALTPATTGEAPLLRDGTGSPAFLALWTLCGVPAISLPLLTGPAGLPLGVQVVGAGGRDERLLATAAWLCRRLEIG